ncbi:MAG: radical SAM protein [Thermodesulfobacteriota bacterium]
MPSPPAIYMATHAAGILNTKIGTAHRLLEQCSLCPRQCGVNRTRGQTGVCGVGAEAVVYGFHPHFGEERPLVGSNGSGTIFFSHCNLLCNFCQNYEISHDGEGETVSDEQLGMMMVALQRRGCHNINLVTPSHVVPQILGALKVAITNGLTIPLVYNTSSYDQTETLGLLEGIIDIYMPDFKFWDAGIAEKTCGAGDYPLVARQALVEMHRQVGDLRLDDKGIARRGILLRHLVLPDNLAGTRDIMRFIAREISENTYVNIMPQYRPCGRAGETDGMDRPITTDEFEAALIAAKEEGITRLDQRKRVLMVG